MSFDNCSTEFGNVYAKINIEIWKLAGKENKNKKKKEMNDRVVNVNQNTKSMECRDTQVRCTTEMSNSTETSNA